MCVIFACLKHKSVKLDVKLAFKDNPDGAGIAWRQNGKVMWSKGLTLKQTLEAVEALEPPYVLHFRSASSGSLDNRLCHPFPVEDGGGLELEGATKSVLFHNGTFKGWRGLLIQLATSHKNWQIPDGIWSDTRAMAILANNLGRNFLALTTQKVCLFETTKTYLYGSWVKENGNYFSNLYFRERPAYKYNKGYDKLDEWNGSYDNFSEPCDIESCSDSEELMIV
jgi:predicted glutamine amidotransferase